MSALARALGVTHQAVRKWQAGGRMPRTEWTGETTYCDTIERLTSGVVTKAMLLDKWPAWVPPTRATRCESGETLQQVAP